MTDILDDVAVHLSCPTEGCAGEIRSTFGKLMANPEVTCWICNTKTEVHFGEEDLQAARDALQAGAESIEN